jgi:hypothetical protein
MVQQAAWGRGTLRQIATALVLAGSVLAGCGPGPDVDARNASVAEVAEQVRDATDDAQFIRPGKWRSQVTMEDVSAPGVPPQVREHMQGMLKGAQSYESCLSPEQAGRPNENFFAPGDNQCRYEHFRMGDGKIDAKMQCSEGGGSQVMDMAGTYSPDSYQLRMSTKTEFPGGAAEGMTMRMRVDAKRVGECEAKQS